MESLSRSSSSDSLNSCNSRSSYEDDDDTSIFEFDGELANEEEVRDDEDGDDGVNCRQTPTPPLLSPSPLKATPAASHCAGCRCKLGLMRFQCRCGETFCLRHQTGLSANIYGSSVPDGGRSGHLCNFDYSAAERQRLGAAMRETIQQHRTRHGMPESI